MGQYLNNAKKKMKKLKSRLMMMILLLIMVAVISGLVIFSPISLRQVALALTGNYSKTGGDSLESADWNNLDDDFVAKSGDTMTGDLTVPNLIITDTCTGCGGGGGAEDTSGNPLRVVCGQTPQGATDWQDYGANPFGIYLDVDTSAAGFVSTPMYFTSLGGVSNHWTTMGAASIYSPTPNSFRIFIYYTEAIDPDTAKTGFQWFINWCGVGN